MMSQERPVLTIKKSIIDKILDYLTIGLVCFIWVYSYMNFVKLPDYIPVHFNDLGFPNGYGSKQSIWIIPTIVTIVIVALRILNHFPHKFNFLTNITAENAERQYRLSIRLLRIISFNIAALFNYIVYKEIQGALEGFSTLDWWFIPLLMTALVVPTFWMMIVMSKNNTSK